MPFSGKHKSNRKLDRHNSKQQQIAERIVSRCQAIQNNASKSLQAKFETLATGSKRLTVVAFCIVGFSLSVCLIIRSFSKQAYKPISITTIRVPKQAVVNGQQPLRPVAVITKEEFEKIRKFRLYLDSLVKSQQGKSLYDIIIIYRINNCPIVGSCSIAIIYFSAKATVANTHKGIRAGYMYLSTIGLIT